MWSPRPTGPWGSNLKAVYLETQNSPQNPIGATRIEISQQNKTVRGGTYFSVTLYNFIKHIPNNNFVLEKEECAYQTILNVC